MRKTGSLMVLIAAAFIIGGASSCGTPETEDLVGTWDVKCFFKDETIVWPTTWWSFAPQPMDQPIVPDPTNPDPSALLAKFKEIIQNSQGGLEATESFYLYQKGVLFLKDPLSQNQDRIYTLLSSDKDHYKAIGTNVQCDLSRSAQQFP